MSFNLHQDNSFNWHNNCTRFAVFSAPGTYTFTPPISGIPYTAFIWGAGGGGACAMAASKDTHFALQAQGGASGAMSTTTAILTSNTTVVVGAGGVTAAPASLSPTNSTVLFAGSIGGTGGSSSFNSVTAAGGLGGGWSSDAGSTAGDIAAQVPASGNMFNGIPNIPLTSLSPLTVAFRNSAGARAPFFGNLSTTSSVSSYTGTTGSTGSNVKCIAGESLFSSNTTCLPVISGGDWNMFDLLGNTVFSKTWESGQNTGWDTGAVMPQFVGGAALYSAAYSNDSSVTATLNASAVIAGTAAGGGAGIVSARGTTGGGTTSASATSTLGLSGGDGLVVVIW